ncbi:MAG: L,D-transpeptidase, partial [Thermoleophilaceae bacterium]
APEAAEAELAEAKVQPADAEAEPAETEPAEAEPAEAEPAETEPAETEPAEAEPAEAEAEPAAPPSEPAAPEPAPPPESAPGAPAPEPQPSPTVAAATSPPQPPDQPDPDVLPPPDGPVLEMLAAREPQVPDSPRRAVTLALLGIGVAGLVGAGGVVGATQFGETNRLIQSEAGRDSDDATRHFTPEQGGFLAAPFPTDPSTVSCYSIANVPGSTVLYRRPGGKKRVRITPRTEWGSPRVLGVIKQRGAWLAVQAPELRNGELAWARREDAQLDCVRWSLHADLSDRTLSVRHDGRTVRKMQVAIGRRENPTPEGRFTVTDKLRVTDPNSAYGCCVIALSGHQTDLPAYWPGGDRLAVHATADESSIGRPVSLGCMRTDSHRARWLIRTIPLGAPMFITA